MILFSTVDGIVGRLEGAEWISPPFDLGLLAPAEGNARVVEAGGLRTTAAGHLTTEAGGHLRTEEAGHLGTERGGGLRTEAW